jgi:arabinogalactan oligomer/maltooligosaccharide transport system permease protein
LEPLTALLQVISCLLLAILLIGGVELVLYVMLCHWRAKWQWPLMAALGGLVGLGTAYALGGVPEGGETFVWAQEAGFFAASVILLATAGSRYVIKGRWAIPFLMLAPALLIVTLLVIYPFFFEVRLAFANLNLYTIGKWLHGEPLGYVGLKNFIRVFTSSPLQTATFWVLFWRTLLWTGINLVFHVGFGLGLAMLLCRPIMGRGLYRMLLIVPWAMPQVVAVLAWRGEFHPQFGMVNQLFHALGFAGVNWWSDPIPVFISCCIVNIWLGIPFMMIVFLGGLQSISKSYYEAASIDGASKLTQFFQITLPMLRPTVVPSVTLGTIWTFNNINVIYLMTGQDGGNEYADILVSALYKSAFTYTRYSFAAAFALVLFAILMLLTMFWMKVSKGTESATAR